MEVVLRVVHVHVLSLASTRLWLRMLDELPPASPKVLRIIAGDFNATLDHSPFRAVLNRGYADAADRAGHGLEPTYPADSPIGIAIDHVLVDRRIGVDRVPRPQRRGHATTTRWSPTCRSPPHPDATATMDSMKASTGCDRHGASDTCARVSSRQPCPACCSSRVRRVAPHAASLHSTTHRSQVAAIDDIVRLNQIQVIGSHNSYHQMPPAG